jgi:hypothetical protein
LAASSARLAGSSYDADVAAVQRWHDDVVGGRTDLLIPMDEELWTLVDGARAHLPIGKDGAAANRTEFLRYALERVLSRSTVRASSFSSRCRASWRSVPSERCRATVGPSATTCRCGPLRRWCAAARGAWPRSCCWPSASRGAGGRGSVLEMALIMLLLLLVALMDDDDYA